MLNPIKVATYSSYNEILNCKSVIFIGEPNYKERFQEYLDSLDDLRWERIALDGRRHVFENLSNDKGVEMLVGVIRKAWGEENAEI